MIDQLYGGGCLIAKSLMSSADLTRSLAESVMVRMWGMELVII